MSVLDIEAPAESRRAEPIPSTPRTPQRHARGRGRAATPRLRPAGAVPAPTLTPSAPPAHGHACRVATPAVAARPRTVLARSRTVPAEAAACWRLTDRGIAVVLVTVAMVAVAALAVVVPTALRVTGENYQPYGTSQLANP